jgi:tripeptide aminopeptidase
MKSVLERFLEYVTFDTQANSNSKTTPSSASQMEFAKLLAGELRLIGMQDVEVDSNGYVMATLPGNTQLNLPVIGFIAHMDTSPDMTGANIKPQLIKDYNGLDISLNPSAGVVMKISDFPELMKYIGLDLVTTDGTTLLGADDKAGIAEIITAMEWLINHPEIERGTIRICFTPDEEIGQGADHFDVDKFGADFAYTMDGGEIGELEFENFNAAAATVVVNGRNVHPGYAKNKMRNSITMAQNLIAMMPELETPEKTEGYEGFFHLTNFNGNVEKTEMHFIIRDFNKDKFEQRKRLLQSNIDALNTTFGKDTFEVTLHDQYYNMREMIEPVMQVVYLADEAMKQCGVIPMVKPIRGGTDGARLSYMGLPTPNIFAGGHNFHGRYEFIPVQSMEKAVKVILKIVQLAANQHNTIFAKKED